MRLEGKVIYVSGAASGMGRVACTLFAAQGAKLLATDIDKNRLAELSAEVEKAGGQIIALEADIADDAGVAKVFEAGAKHFGKVDALYNNAGIMPDEDTSVVETPEDVYQRVMNVNVKGVWSSCRYGVPLLEKAGGGSIINIASFVGLVGCSVPQDAYTASKGAVLSLTRSLAVQFGPKNIRANAICPGPIETPLLLELFKDEAARNKRLARIPLGRIGKPEDVVNAGIFLASDESRWITGTDFVIDGGITVNYF